MLLSSSSGSWCSQDYFLQPMCECVCVCVCVRACVRAWERERERERERYKEKETKRNRNKGYNKHQHSFPITTCPLNKFPISFTEFCQEFYILQLSELDTQETCNIPPFHSFYTIFLDNLTQFHWSLTTYFNPILHPQRDRYPSREMNQATSCWRWCHLSTVFWMLWRSFGFSLPYVQYEGL